MPLYLDFTNLTLFFHDLLKFDQKFPSKCKIWCGICVRHFFFNSWLDLNLSLKVFTIFQDFSFKMNWLWDERAHPLRHPKFVQACSWRRSSTKSSPNIEDKCTTQWSSDVIAVVVKCLVNELRNSLYLQLPPPLVMLFLFHAYTDINSKFLAIW